MQNSGPVFDEKVLLERVASGDSNAYSQLYTYYTPLLYRFVYPFTDASKEQAEEIVQEVFLKIWIRRETLTSLKSFEAYTFKMAKHQLIDARKREQCFQKIIGQLEHQEESKGSPLENNLIYSEYLTSAEMAIDCLTPQRKKIFDMRTQQNMSIDEISGSLNISKSAVKKQLYEAILFIKQHLHYHTGWPLLYVLIPFFL
ncbi:RNA polymerase sigma-70 factor, ECF subfamily [Pedobacter steynii]|uniref:RNA polymerase sigma-70 factor, ECF subfamily n=1 Tax=Pedobacter steynii TaxID=430522 RepID=A0A1H0G1I5_9SPHI|nr:sigma-70 family RNA polymerase sigma factor [Pedobacter steynii]NQX42291.1 sigma-70 family RNA polymerase sigma factor [Pedobacter steynii]SDO00746.1 RNA polymerase sigma-70 factor, ECF subfamily [Pedobacter steynii]